MKPVRSVTLLPLRGMVQVSGSIDNIYGLNTGEDIVIKAGLDDLGAWQYEVRVDESRLNVHPKMLTAKGQIMAELARQTEAEVQNLKTAGKSNADVTIKLDQGEQMYKKGMALLETVAALYDVTIQTMEDGHIPESIWNQGRLSSGVDNGIKQNYEKSPFKTSALIGGGIDQFVDETIGGLQMVVTVLEAVRKPKATFDNIYHSVKNLDANKLVQVVSSASGYDNYQAGGDRAVYQAGRHSVQVATIAFSGIRNLAKGAEVIKEAGEGISGVQKFIPEGNTNNQVRDALKNAVDNQQVVKNIDNEKLLTKNVVNGEETFVSIEKNGENLTKFEAKRSDFIDDNGHPLSDAAIEEALEEGAKDINLPHNPDDSYKKGTKGGWNKDLNAFPPPANKVFNIDGVKYHTDDLGRVTDVEVDILQKSVPPSDRNSYQQSLKCNKAKNGTPGQDQGGHLLAADFGGAGEQINLVPMNKSVNQSPGTWYNMERDWSTKLSNGIVITNLKIKVVYQNDFRPIKFEVEWFEDGVRRELEHFNP